MQPTTTTLHVRAHILRNTSFTNWDAEVRGRWDWHQLMADENYRKGWISFDGVLWHPELKQLFCGLMELEADIFYRFDPASGAFQSLGFREHGSPYDAKFHRSMLLDDDGALFCATSMLHDPDRQAEAPGGRIIHYDPRAHAYRQVAIPIPRQYIQSIALDRRRRLIYGFTYPAEYFFQHDLKTGETRQLAFLGNPNGMCQPHVAVVDRAGWLWGQWGENRAFDDVPCLNLHLFKYHPDEGRIHWLRHTLARPSDGDVGAIDGMCLAPDGNIYIGTKGASLFRLRPESEQLEYLGRPGPRARMSGMVAGPDGRIYLACGEREECGLYSLDPAHDTLTHHGHIRDEALGASAERIHDLTVTEDLVLYAGENDNHDRSSYLWELRP